MLKSRETLFNYINLTYLNMRTHRESMSENIIQIKAENILQNNWPVLFKSVKAMKDGQRLGTSQMGETKKTWQLDAM